MRHFLAFGSFVSLCSLVACGGGATVKRPYPAFSAQDAVAKLRAAQQQISAFSAESTMDYWVGKDRVKGTVLVMGTPGAHVRFNGLSPAGESVMADLACDGSNFAMVDFQNNCQLAGPCNADSIAQFLRVPMQPDDFFWLAVGLTPVLADDAGVANAELQWNAKDGTEALILKSVRGVQRIVIDARDGRFDVRHSELRTADNALVWAVDNTGFATVTDEAGKAFRLPAKTRFAAPGEKSDLIVDWESRKLNLAIAADKFVLTPPQGLASCK